MKRYLLLLLIWSAAWLLIAFEPHFTSDPAISPDGEMVCFTFSGDLWLVPFTGGEAKRLTSTETNEYGACWSPDGSKIAFNANREGQTWVYTIPSTGGIATPVFKEPLSVCDWFADGKSLLCTRYTSYGNSLFKVPLSGTRPVMIAEIGDYFSALSPDNMKIIFNRHGDAYRESYRGSTNGELWEYDISTQIYTRLTNTDYTERYPRYAYASNSTFFTASDGKVYQLYRIDNGNYTKRFKLTDFSTWSARDISIARQNDRVVYEYFDQLWLYDPTRLGKTVAQLKIEINEDNWTNRDVDESVTDTYEHYAVSGDDLLTAFSYKYDLFVLPKKGGEVKQLTHTHNGVENIAFLPDNRTILFSRYADGIKSLFSVKVDSIFTVQPVKWYGAGKYHVDDFYRSSPYHWVIEYSDSTGGGKVAVADSLMQNAVPVLTDKVISSDFCFSPDGTMAVYATNRNDIWVRELYLYDFSTQAKRKIKNDENWIWGLTWTPDQKSILMVRDGIDRLDLVARDEFELDVDNWKEVFSPSKAKDTEADSTAAVKAKADKKTKDKKEPNPRLQYAQIDWNNLDKRFSDVLSGEGAYPVYAIDDTTFYYFKNPSPTATGADKDKVKIYKANIYGKNSSEVATLSSEPNYQFNADKHLYFKDGSKLKDLNLKTKSKTELNNHFHYTYNLHRLNEKVFEQVWGIFGRNFYDPKMHGRDWKEMYSRFSTYLPYAQTTSTLSIIIEEMIGELNASHTGYYPRSEGRQPNLPIAYLGLEIDYRQSLAIGLSIRRIYPGSRLYDFYGIRSGDVILAIDGTELSPRTALDSLLADKIDKKISVNLLHEGKPVSALIKGLNYSQNRELAQTFKLDNRKKQVDELSGNKLGYVYIPRMGYEDYTNFVNDFVRDNMDKAALILDIRGNGGGRIHNSLLDFLTNKPNAYTTDRTYGAVKRETPNRSWTKPIVLLIDENSFSDAEIFPQLFKEAKLGTIIGMPTSGSVIGTWEVDLLDGSSMRMPGSGWYRLDGVNMEGNGAQPDILLEMTPNELAKENDIQLKKAVEILLEKLK